MQLHNADARFLLYTQNGADGTSRFPRLVSELGSLPGVSAIIDGELVHTGGLEALHRAVPKHLEDHLALRVRPHAAQG